MKTTNIGKFLTLLILLELKKTVHELIGENANMVNFVTYYKGSGVFRSSFKVSP